MARVLFLVCSLILSAGPACVPLAPPGIASAPATGIDGAMSRQVIVARDGHDVLVGRALVLRQAGAVAYVAEVAQIRRGGQVRLRMDSAWHNGQRLPFSGATRVERYCLDQRACQALRTGTFSLTRQQFTTAAATGLRATLVGPDGAVEVNLPSTLFTEARDHARAAGLWTDP